MPEAPLSSETGRYVAFIDELRNAMTSPKDAKVAALLDGLAGSRCLELLQPEVIRSLGAFFTPSTIARRVADAVPTQSGENFRFFDPACGAADLLLPIAARLPVARTVSSTLRAWNEKIAGCDVSAEFIEAGKLRLILLAANRGAVVDGGVDGLTCLLDKLVVSDGLTATDQYRTCTHIVMNPPYGRIPGTVRPWRLGSTSAAALFLERASELSAAGTQIVALLPEVLRTGASYKSWREHIFARVTTNRPISIGRFSPKADVDVFIQRFVRRNDDKPREKTAPKKSVIQPQVKGIPTTREAGDNNVGSKFAVAVGTVVPFRHRKCGKEYAYLHAGNALPWAEISRINEVRKFTGRVFRPPFVVVRRTSRPGDKYRAVATLVLGKRLVAVENHLLVLTPRRGASSICRILVRLFKQASTNARLDQAMRCRHLTVGSVSTLPWA